MLINPHTKYILTHDQLPRLYTLFYFKVSAICFRSKRPVSHSPLKNA